MQEVYKQYLIRGGAAALRNAIGFKPIAQVNWNEDGKERVRLWMEWHFAEKFATYDEAEKEALRFAKNWVDERRRFTPV
jgi:hypothetical protein